MKAIPAATDARFKVAPFLLLVSWLTILVSLWHSVRHYEARNRGLVNRMLGFVRYVPFRFFLMIPLSLVVIGYQALAAWDFDLSPLKKDTNLVAMYVGGYVPGLLLIIILCISGFMRPNEDKELIRQRRERGAQLDQELGIAKRPAWWKRLRGEVSTGDAVRDELYRNVREVGGGQRAQHVAEQRAATVQATALPPATNGGGIEMSSIRRTPSVTSATAPPPYTPAGGVGRGNDRMVQAAASLLFPNGGNPLAPAEPRGRGAEALGQPTRGPGNNARSSSTATSVSMTAPPQQIRSMLDV